jgi:glutathione S-transferase
MTAAPESSATLSLVERRVIRAPVERVFAAWTEPARLREWWGPRGVTCTEAHMDLRVGGTFRLANRLPDGVVVWISGEFIEVHPPSKLVYTWRLGNPPDGREQSQVTVRFEPRSSGTEVIVIHERMATPELRDHTVLGWQGCLEKLDAYFGA